MKFHNSKLHSSLKYVEGNNGLPKLHLLPPQVQIPRTPFMLFRELKVLLTQTVDTF